MACQGVIDFVTRESGRFSEQIYSRMFPKSPIIALIKKEGFPEGMGDTISNLTYERQAPAEAEPTWTSIVNNQTSGSLVNYDTTEGGNCLPPAHKIGAGSTVRNYAVKRRVLEGPDFCVEDLRSPFAIAKQLTSILDTLGDYAMLEWEIFYRHQLARTVKRKVVAIAAGPVETTTAAFLPTSADTATCADMLLSQGLLNRYRTKLRRDGAAMSAMGMDSGAPIFTLLAGEEALDRLIFDNADIRQDLRWGKPSELLRAYGVERSYRGFFHMIDSFPMRFTCDGGNYTEVPAFVGLSATKGNKSDVNGPYEGSSGTVATHETAIIFDPAILTARIPKPITAPAPGYKFDPVNYSGVFSVRNILDRTCNPDGTIIFHRGIMAAGIEPVHPERGVLFVFKKCDAPLNAVTAC